MSGQGNQYLANLRPPNTYLHEDLRQVAGDQPRMSDANSSSLHLLPASRQQHCLQLGVVSRSLIPPVGEIGAVRLIPLKYKHGVLAAVHLGMLAAG
jgi:hypothetical protein